MSLIHVTDSPLIDDQLDLSSEKTSNYPNEVIKTINWYGHKLVLSTGKIAKQADGAVMAQLGNTVVLCTVVFAKQNDQVHHFFPLVVNYREMSFAAGKIPGGFIKREGKQSDQEVLVSRLIDRIVRPLFPSDFTREIQIICTVLSHDSNCSPDVVAIIGASAALAISGVPIFSTFAAVKVGYVDRQLVINPNFEQLKSSKLDLVIGGSDSSITMVEGMAAELTENEFLEALKYGHQAFQAVIELINDLKVEAGKSLLEVSGIHRDIDHDLVDRIKTEYHIQIKEGFSIKNKHLREQYFSTLAAQVNTDLISSQDCKETESLSLLLSLKKAKIAILRENVLKFHERIGGRNLTDIRDINCEIELLPKTHGSAVFTRGETQAVAVTTLGTSEDEQIVDSLSGSYREHFLLHYIFPSYSVGEVGALKAPGRREIGHGYLARKAIEGVLPNKAEFPYTIRVVSEITESDGSSSMATVCATTLSLMDAGVPIKSMVAGIAMGLIKDGDEFAILSDILGDEDYLGDMDFKVAGTKNGITALQMDIKVSGIDFSIISKALEQAKLGRIHILEEMNKVISIHRPSVSKHAPVIKTMKIDKDRIRDLIGPSGKVIKNICEKTNTKIDINDTTGVVQISAGNLEKLEQAFSMILAVTSNLEVGATFKGTVEKIIESGMFVNYSSLKDGFVHISEIADHRVDDINNYVKLGQEVTVTVIGFDPRGKVRLSMKSKDDVSSSHRNNGRSKLVESDGIEKRSREKKEEKLKEEKKIIPERKYFS